MLGNRSTSASRPWIRALPDRSLSVVGFMVPGLEVFIKQLRFSWNLTALNGACLFVFLLLLFEFSLLLWSELGLFLLFPFAFIFTPLITHICFSMVENECPLDKF